MNGIVQCARCGAEIDTAKRKAGIIKRKIIYSAPYIKFYAGRTMWTEPDKYFCADCERSFARWLNNPENK